MKKKKLKIYKKNINKNLNYYSYKKMRFNKQEIDY